MKYNGSTAAEKLDFLHGILSDSNSSVNWLFIGDSIMHGASHTHGHRDFSELLRERFRWELRRENDLFLNAAFSGYTSQKTLEKLPACLENYKPDLALLLVGVNDTTHGVKPEDYQHNLECIYEMLEKKGCMLCLVTTLCPIGRWYDEFGSAYEGIYNAMMETAEKLSIPVFDLHKESRQNHCDIYNHCDDLHPNNTGHIKIAYAILKQMGFFDPENSNLCRLFVPRETMDDILK